MLHRLFTKNKITILLIFGILTLFNSNSYSINRNNNYEIMLQQIQNALDCSRDSSVSIFNIVNVFADNIKEVISSIASSNSKVRVDSNYINRIVNKYFASDQSIVQVSNLKKPLKFYFIKNYLHHLNNLKKTYGYTKVILTFDPDYLAMSKIEKIGPNRYELSVTMVQFFSGFRDNILLYSDTTRKKFRFIFNVSNNSLRVAIDEISVSETIPMKKYY